MHAAEFHARLAQFQKLGRILDRSPIVVSPYDAELFGHWWFEGPEFLDALVRLACATADSFELVTPGDYLERQPVNQVCTPSATSWGEQGYLRVWLNEKTTWIYPHLRAAQDRMTGLVETVRKEDALAQRALQQAARELCARPPRGVMLQTRYSERSLSKNER